MIRPMKKKITSLLREVTPNVYSERADDNALYPYIVFSFPSISHQEGLFKGYLDVDIWDKNSSSATVDELSDEVMKALDRYRYIDGGVEMTLYLYTVLTVESEDKNLRRKTVIFETQFRRVN